MSDIKIRQATPLDAPLIAEGLVNAIGEDHCQELAGDTHTVDDIKGIFAQMAVRDDTQYSYLNSRIAVDEDGTPLGVCIAYDGALLERLRQPFLDIAGPVLGIAGPIQDETDADEVYLDTLYVLPKARKRGVGRALIEDAARKAALIGKPLGLLVDYANARAERLYTACGFKHIAPRNFFGTEMRHMLRPNLD